MGTTTPIKLVHLPVEGEWSLEDIEVTNAEVHPDRETVEVGGGGLLGSTYLVVSGADLLVAAECLRALADRIGQAVVTARQDALDAERQTCHYCGTPRAVEPGADTCGSGDCERRFAAEVYADLALGGI